MSCEYIEVFAIFEYWKGFFFFVFFCIRNSQGTDLYVSIFSICGGGISIGGKV